MRMSSGELGLAIRALRRRPLFAALAITTIALGTGATTAIYTVVDRVVVRPLPFHGADRLVAVWQTNELWKKSDILAAKWDHVGLSFSQYRDIEAHQTGFENIGVWTAQNATLMHGDRPEVVTTLFASASLLAVLDLKPELGRGFIPEETRPHGAPVVLISYEAWQARYGSDRGVLGRTIQFESGPRLVIGVLPKNLANTQTALSHANASYWFPAGQDSSQFFERGIEDFRMIGRLKPGVSLGRISAELDPIAHPEPADRKLKHIYVAKWQADDTRDVRRPLLLLLAGAGLLLLIACANVSTLLLGEAVARKKEIATRAFLGASSGRILWQLVVEQCVLAGIGAAVGLMLAVWGTQVLVALAPPSITGLTGIRPDLRILIFAAGLAVFTSIATGLLPASSLARDAQPDLLVRAGGQSERRGAAAQRTMVAVELAMSVVLLVGAGLLMRTLERITRVDPGFRANDLLVIQPSLPRNVMSDTAAMHKFYDQALIRIASVPSVVSVTAGSQPPFVGSSSVSSFKLEGETGTQPGGTPAKRHQAQQRVVVPGYFRSLGIPLFSGRDFSNEDRAGGENTVIVSKALVRRDFGAEIPIGRKIFFLGKWRTIVGVVDDTHLSRLRSDVEPTLYTPYAQRGAWSLAILVRSAGDPASLAPTIRSVITQIQPLAVAEKVEVMSDAIRRSFAEERYRATIIVLFGALATILASVGMYGVTARSVARRRREVAIRVAVGAAPGVVRREVAATTLRGVAVGMAAGFLVAFGAARLLTPYLFGISAADPPTYAAIFVLLFFVSLAASWLPAMKATSTDIVGVLRHE